MASRAQGAIAFLLAAASPLIVGSSAVAGGFALPDQGARGMGMGGAHVARATDPSAIFYNVAGLAFVEQPEISLGGTLLLPTLEFTGADPFPGQATQEKITLSPQVPPTLDYAHPVGEWLVVGIGFHTPFGLKTEWAAPEAFSGRFIAQNTSLTCRTVSPAVALKLADRLAIGAALDVNFASLQLQRRLPVIDPFTLRRVDAAVFNVQSDTSTALSFHAGLFARFTENLAFGASYRHGVPLDMTGAGTTERLQTGSLQTDNRLATLLPAAPVPFSLRVELPEIVSGGLAYTWNDWTFAGQMDWQRWSSIGSLTLDFAGRPELRTELLRNYANAYVVRGGVERRINHLWTIRGGYYYDTTPAPTDSLSPVSADADRQGIVLGASLKQGAWRIDVAPGLVLYKTRSTLGANPEGYDGTYKNLVPVLGVSIGRTF
jgi:long-chain fatty acid transport protein